MEGPRFFNRMTGFFGSFFRWFRQRKLAMGIFFLFFLAFPLYILIITMILPPHSSPEMARPASADSSRTESTAGPVDISEEMHEKITAISVLEIQRAFLKNRYDLAGASDSVYMVINLPDSTIDLEIKGVTVRSCPILDFRISKNLGKASGEELFQWISSPFQLQDALATIPKIPYVIKEAPKDTLEAQAQSAKPMPVDTTAVYFTLFFNKDLVLEVEQAEPPVEADMPFLNEYREIKKQALRQETVRALFHSRAPEQDLYIRIEVNQADARAIYRGIPVNAMLAVKL